MHSETEGGDWVLLDPRTLPALLRFVSLELNRAELCSAWILEDGRAVASDGHTLLFVAPPIGYSESDFLKYVDESLSPISFPLGIPYDAIVAAVKATSSRAKRKGPANALDMVILTNDSIRLLRDDILIRYSPIDGTPPNFDLVVPRERESSVVIRFDPALMGRVISAIDPFARESTYDSTTFKHIDLSFGTDKQPVLITSGESFEALIMPIRRDS